MHGPCPRRDVMSPVSGSCMETNSRRTDFSIENTRIGDVCIDIFPFSPFLQLLSRVIRRWNELDLSRYPPAGMQTDDLFTGCDVLRSRVKYRALLEWEMGEIMQSLNNVLCSSRSRLVYGYYQSAHTTTHAYMPSPRSCSATDNHLNNSPSSIYTSWHPGFSCMSP